METLSKSAIETFYSCPKKYEYTYGQGYESKFRGPETRFGLAGHLALERFLKGGSAPSRDDYSAFDLSDLDYHKLNTVLARWKEYVRVPETVTYVEHEFSLPAIGVRGIFDGIAQPNLDEVVIIEHKFTKTDFSNSDWWFSQWKTSWQVGLYLLAAKHLFGAETVSVWLNAIRIPQIRQRPGEPESHFIDRIDEHIETSPGAYFQQAKVSWSEESLARIENDLTDTTNLIKKGVFPRSRNCLQFMRRCDFYPVCFEGKTLQDSELYQIRSRR